VRKSVSAPLATASSAQSPSGSAGRNHFGAFALIVALLLVLDQATKAAARACLSSEEVLTLVPGVLGLQLVENRGAAFGIFSGHVAAFAVLAVVILAACVAYLIRGHVRGWLVSVSLAMVCAGGLGNLIDRVALGYVTDMIRALFIDFPVFNVADCSICIGVVLFFIAIIRGTK
jgi:signal peptidase II